MSECRICNPELSARELMELRDKFAGQAMQGMMTVNQHAILDTIIKTYGTSKLTFETGVAKMSYDMADAMMEARK